MSEQKLYVAVYDLSFCLHDEDGNEVQNKNGTTKQFHLAYKADKHLGYFIDGLEVTDLEEIPEPKKDDQKDMDFIQRQLDLGIE
jgi:hypothetical protein